MKRKFIFFLIICLALNIKLKSQDTSIVEILKVPFPVLSMVGNSKGEIYLHSKSKIYLFKNKVVSFFKNCSSEEREMILVHDSISFLPRKASLLKIYFNRLSKNHIWKKFIPEEFKNDYVFVAKDENQNIWITSGIFLFKIHIDDKISVLAKNASIRGIDTLGENWIVNTYDGIYLNHRRIWPEIEFSNGNLLKLGGNKYLIASNHLFLIENDLVSIIKKEPLEMNWSRLIQYKGKIFLGSDRGIYEYKNRMVTKTNFLMPIHNLEIIDDKLVSLTEKGIYYLDNGIWTHLKNAPSLGFNGVKKVGDFYYWLSDQGVYYSKTFGGEFKLKWNQNIICYEIQTDKYGVIWMSTSNGIYRFMNGSESYEYLLPGIEFNKRSSFQKENYIYFGSTRGLYKFNINKFKMVKNNLARETSLVLNFCLMIALCIGLYHLCQTCLFKKQD